MRIERVRDENKEIDGEQIRQKCGWCAARKNYACEWEGITTRSSFHPVPCLVLGITFTSNNFLRSHQYQVFETSGINVRHSTGWGGMVPVHPPVTPIRAWARPGWYLCTNQYRVKKYLVLIQIKTRTKSRFSSSVTRQLAVTFSSSNFFIQHSTVENVSRHLSSQCM